MAEPLSEGSEGRLGDSMFRHTESYYPFPSKLFALLFFHLHSPRPMGQTNLSFMWATLKGAGVEVPSLSQDSCKEVYCEIDTLVDFNRFAQIVPDTEAYIPEHVNIIFDMIAIPISSVHAICEKPAEVIKWDELAHSFIRLSHEDSCNYLKPNHLKTKAAGRKVVMLPLILFTDDLSGNKSKKWHKFESWYLMLAGLPRHENAKPENIHFVSCTDLMDVLDMTECVAQQLQQLELDGLIVYDSFYKETVLVIAPLLCVICDNPRASQLLNHLGGSAKKFCRFCMADRDTTPCSVCEERTRDISLQQIQEIQSQRTEKAKSDKSTEVGLRDVPNSLLHILADLFKCGSGLRELYNTNAVQHFFNSVPMKLLNKTKTIYQPGCGRKASKNVVLFGTVKIDTQDLSSVTFSQLLTMDPPFQIVGLDFDDARQQSVVQCRAVVSHNNELIHAGDYVKFYAPVNEVQQYNDHALHFIYMYFSIHVVHVWSTPYNSPVNIKWCNFVLCQRV
eukprot:Em0022g678a